MRMRSALQQPPIHRVSTIRLKIFLSQYNSLINEITSLYNADSAKGYEPLTDDEKDAMSDTEVEKWEQKIKDSLLRRDDNLKPYECYDFCNERSG